MQNILLFVAFVVKYIFNDIFDDLYIINAILTAIYKKIWELVKYSSLDLTLVPSMVPSQDSKTK